MLGGFQKQVIVAAMRYRKWGQNEGRYPNYLRPIPIGPYGRWRGLGVRLSVEDFELGTM